MIYIVGMKTILCLLLVATLSSCRLPEPAPESSPEKRAEDQAFWECDYEARAATAEISDGIVARRKQDVLLEACMKAKGYDW